MTTWAEAEFGKWHDLAPSLAGIPDQMGPQIDTVPGIKRRPRTEFPLAGEDDPDVLRNTAEDIHFELDEAIDMLARCRDALHALREGLICAVAEYDKVVEERDSLRFELASAEADLETARDEIGTKDYELEQLRMELEKAHATER